MTFGDKRAYEVEPWGIRKGLIVKSDDWDVTESYYTRTDETMIASNLFKYCCDDLRFLNTKQARTIFEKRAVVDGRHISSHFLNMMTSLRLNLYTNGTTPPAMDINTALDHIFFYTPTECLDMNDTFVCHIGSLVKEEFKDIHRKFQRKWAHIFTEKVPHPTDNTKTLADWFSRLGPSVKQLIVGSSRLQYKKTHPAAAMHTSSYTSESEKIAETPAAIYTVYTTTDATQLLKLMRNLRVHWGDYNLVVKTEICQQTVFDADKFLKYFTVRYPGLFLTIYEFCCEWGIGKIALNTNIKFLPSLKDAKGQEYKIVHSEYVSDDEILEAKNKIATNSHLTL